MNKINSKEQKYQYYSICQKCRFLVCQKCVGKFCSNEKEVNEMNDNFEKITEEVIKYQCKKCNDVFYKEQIDNKCSTCENEIKRNFIRKKLIDNNIEFEIDNYLNDKIEFLFERDNYTSSEFINIDDINNKFYINKKIYELNTYISYYKKKLKLYEKLLNINFESEDK